MERYDYYASVKVDVTSYINELLVLNSKKSLNDLYSSFDDAIEELDAAMWTADNVTGNGSGSYTFSTWQAEEYLCHNLDLLQAAAETFCSTINFMNPEECDVTIRCYLLRQTIDEVVSEFWRDED